MTQHFLQKTVRLLCCLRNGLREKWQTSLICLVLGLTTSWMLWWRMKNQQLKKNGQQVFHSQLFSRIDLTHLYTPTPLKTVDALYLTSSLLDNSAESLGKKLPATWLSRQPCDSVSFSFRALTPAFSCTNNVSMELPQRNKIGCSCSLELLMALNVSFFCWLVVYLASWKTLLTSCFAVGYLTATAKKQLHVHWVLQRGSIHPRNKKVDSHIIPNWINNKTWVKHSQTTNQCVFVQFFKIVSSCSLCLS